MKEISKLVLELNATKHTNKQICEITNLDPVVIRNVLTRYGRRSYTPPPEQPDPLARSSASALPLPAFHPIAMANLPKLKSLEGQNYDRNS